MTPPNSAAIAPHITAIGPAGIGSDMPGMPNIPSSPLPSPGSNPDMPAPGIPVPGPDMPGTQSIPTSNPDMPSSPTMPGSPGAPSSEPTMPGQPL